MARRGKWLRAGFTLMELLVVIALLGILLALLLIAVQRSRAVAARSGCQNNLRQIALALQNYQSSHGSFPPGAAPPSHAAALIHLLPFLDQGDKYKQYDLTKDLNLATQVQAQIGDISVFLCPNDPSPGGRAPRGTPFFGRSNYFVNHGTSARFSNADQATAGMFDYALDGRGVRPGQVTDGSSNTVAFSEIKRGNPQDSSPLETDVTWIALTGEWSDDYQPFPECDNFEQHTVFKYTGCQYYRGYFITSFYTHTAVPNYKGRDCVHLDVNQKTTLDRGHQAARSYHPGGVNAAFADGSVHFIRDTISLALWKALGTRAAGDDTSSY